jgi:hypothetical protein
MKVQAVQRRRRHQQKLASQLPHRWWPAAWLAAGLQQRAVSAARRPRWTVVPVQPLARSPRVGTTVRAPHQTCLRLSVCVCALYLSGGSGLLLCRLLLRCLWRWLLEHSGFHAAAENGGSTGRDTQGCSAEQWPRSRRKGYVGPGGSGASLRFLVSSELRGFQGCV